MCVAVCVLLTSEQRDDVDLLPSGEKKIQVGDGFYVGGVLIPKYFVRF